ncbi:MAG: GNAT family N-acetyltransferase [Pirellulales bacterium]|nr:GNAT family N-acetyltransferase [Pirellulales bacterium]
MRQIHLRRIEPDDRSEVAELICVSMNYGFLSRGLPPRFSGGPAASDIFFEVYEKLDPGCGVVAVGPQNGRLMGSCFFHPRPTHVSVGIMNVHPNYLGKGVARAMLQAIIDDAQRSGKPLRLVSSAMNLDSFSLYTRAGFVPCRAYQDMCVEVPDAGIDDRETDDDAVREATADDVPAMVAVERELVGIERGQDFRYCLADAEGSWHASVCEDGRGGLNGFMISSAHPGCNMIGPGLARTQRQAAALIRAELNRHRGRRPIVLVPVECGRLVRQMYRWGARNCEMHFYQIRGDCAAPRGVHFPAFLPETG